MRTLLRDPAAVFQRARAQRVITGRGGVALVLPSWVRRDPELLERVTRKKFAKQAALDEYLSLVAKYRGVENVEFAPKHTTCAFDLASGLETKRDRKRTANGNVLNAIKNGEFR